MPLLLVGSPWAQPAGDEAALQARRERLRQKWEAQFRAADLDQDGLLSLEECRGARFPAAICDHFPEIDTDGDGRLSPSELWAVYQSRLDRQHPQHPAQ